MKIIIAIMCADEFIDCVGKERAVDYDDVIKNPIYLTQKVKNGDYDIPHRVCLMCNYAIIA